MLRVTPIAEAKESVLSYSWLKGFRLFSNLNADELEYLEKATLVRKVKRHQLVYLQGDRPDAVYLVKKGRVKISRNSEDGRELTLEVLGPRKMFGELDVLEGTHRDTIAEVLEDATIVLLRAVDFETVLHKNMDMMFLLTKLIGLRLKKTENRIEDLVFRDVPTRLARLLLELSNEFRGSPGESILSHCRITHQELANLTGATRETVSSALSDFKKDGLIQQAHRYITILDHERLSMV